MQVTYTQRNSLTDNADGRRSTTIILNNCLYIKLIQRNGNIEEIVKPIINYTGYFISNVGKVYCNLGKGNRDKNKTVPLYEIHPRLTRNGYARIYARNSTTNKRKDLYIHRLVAEYFIPNPQHKKYVNHINCIRSDNRAENLEWVTAKENTDYTMEVNHMIREYNGQYKENYQYKIV